MSDFKINAAKAQAQLTKLLGSSNIKEKSKEKAKEKLKNLDVPAEWKRHNKPYTSQEVMRIFKQNFKSQNKKFDSHKPDESMAEFITDYYGVKDIGNKNEFRNFFNTLLSDLESSFSKGKTKVEQIFRLLKK